MANPPPPVNVRLVYDDGREIPVECTHTSTDHNGLAHWEIATPYDPARVCRIRADLIPGRTSITLPLFGLETGRG